jgi:hypothetical protein
VADLTELAHSVIRIPVAGPKPNNTLAFVRGAFVFPEWHGEDTEIVRRHVNFETPFRIDGFLQSNGDFYKVNTKISIAAYIVNLAATDDGDFVCAVDEIEGSLTDDGRLQVKAWIAESDEVDVELTFQFNYSAWVLTYEPRAAEFPVPHERKWSFEQAVGIHDRVSPGRPSDRDRVTNFDKEPKPGRSAP